MPDLEISNLPALAEAGVSANDPLAIADISASETKKVTVKDLIEAGVALIDTGSIPSAKIATLAANQVATAAIQDDAVTNAKLEHSTISLGGISIALGGTDATPAFNLADATGYTTANLSGTISNAQLAGSIANNKLSNSTVSFGGISLALGGTDATPAFDLTDATGYKTTNLVGTITNAQLAGSIDVSKLTGSSISIGGVSIALGGTDATPAFNLTDATGYPTSALVGTITNTQLAGSIANSKLANSSVSIGGVSVALGATDATPAFNLSDATGYPTSALVGTITNAQLAGSIDVAKLSGSTAISLGGVSITLGGTDATPAFNLSDATHYPTSSLVGTITNAQLAGSIANAKLTNSSVSFGGISVALGASDATPAFDLTDATGYKTTSLVGTITNAQLAGSIAVSKLVSSSASVGGVTITLGTTDATPAFDLQDATGYPTSALTGTITNAQLAGSIAATQLVSGSITSTQLAANSVTDAELANNAVDTGAVQNAAITNDKVETSTSATTGLDGATKIRDASITPAKLNTSNLDRSLNVASGNLGINNVITAATRSGITFNAQGLITGTVALAASDLPLATTSAVGGVSIGTGLSVSGAGALSLTNSVTGATVSGLTFNNQGMITAATALVAGDLPVATTSAKGAVQITSAGGLTVDGSGNISTSTSGISAGTYQSITVNNKGVATAGSALTEALIPSLPASKITSGSFDAARIANDSIDGDKLSNDSVAVFQSIAQVGYPTAKFSGQILFDTVSEDAFIWDGNAWQAITTLTKGSLVFGGNFNANTSKMTACTTAGLAAGLAVGSNLPTPSATTDGLYVVVDTAGTPSAPAPVVAFSPPDYILGVTNTTGSSWNEIDLSQTVAGQVASNITFTPYGQLSSTNVQDALQELETEKMGFVGGTLTGQLLIGNTGSLVFEGSTIDAFETTITVADPTSSDKTITFPDTTGTVITSGDTNTVTSTMVDASLVNTNLAAGAAIAFSKLAALTSAQILVGNGSNVPTAVAVTGDISINNAGLTAIGTGVIVNSDISGSAAITGSKVTTGTTSAVGVLQLTDSATSTSATTAATPAAVKIAKDAADAAATTANAALPKAGGTLTDNLIIDNGKELRLSEADGDGSNYTGLKAQTQSGDITLTLPAVAPTANQVLKADASTPTTLTWAADSSTDATKMPLAGGTFTGDVTFTGDSSDGLWDKSASAFVANLTGNVTGNVTGNTSGSSGSCTGNAATATALATARTIGGVSFDGTANITLPGVNASGTQDTSGTAALATQFTVTANDTTNETVYPIFVDAATGSQGAETDSALTYNPSTGALTTTTFIGALTGNVTGNVSGTSGGFTAGDASNLNSGTVATARLGSGTASSSNFLRGDNTWQTIDLTALSASNLTSGTVPDARFPATLPAASGVNLTALNASNLGSGTVATARLGSGTASNSTFLRGDGSWQTVDTSAAGSDTQVQFNNSGAFAGASSLTFNSGTGALTATSFVGALTGNVTGNASGSSGSCTGNAATATALATARTINAVSFDGSANILVPKLVPSSGQTGTAIEIIDTGSDAHVTIDLDGSEKARFATGGDLLIGTTVTSGVPAVGKQLVLASSGNGGMTILGGNTHDGHIFFADTDSSLQGGISYNHDGDYFYFRAAGNTERFRISSTGAAVTGGLTVSGDLTVSGTTTTVNSTTVAVADKNIELGKVSSPSDTTADGGGLTLKGATDKTFNWVNSTDAWTSSEHIQVASGKTFIGDGSTLTALNASNISSGTIAAARVPTLNQNTTGNAASADTVDIAGEGTDATYYPAFVGAIGAGKNVYVNQNKFTCNPSTGLFAATTFSGSGASLTNVNATTLDSIDSGSFLRSDADDTSTGQLTLGYSSQYPLKIVSSHNGKLLLSGTTAPYIRFQETSTDKAYVGWNPNGWLTLANQEDASELRIRDDISFSTDGSSFNTVWHAGNDGAGSGLDADTLDGVQGANYLRSDTSDTFNGALTVDNGTSGSTAFIVKNDEVGLNLASTGTGDTNPREVILNATRQDSGAYPYLRLCGQGGIKFCVDASSERWQINTNGHYIPATDSTYDIGTNSTRVRTVYADTLYGDGSNLTNLPGGGLTVDLVADGDIAAGKPVIMKDNGKAEKVKMIFTNHQADQWGETRTIENNQIYYPDTAYDKSANVYITHYGSVANSGKMCVRAGQVYMTGGYVSFGTEVEYQSSSGLTGLAVCSLGEGTKKFLITYNDGNDFKARVVEVSGTSSNVCTVSSDITFDNGGGTINPQAMAFDPDTNRAVCVYRVANDGSNSHRGYACVFSVSGTTISAGTPVLIENGYTNDLHTCCYDEHTNRLVIAYAKMSNYSGYIRLATIDSSSNTLTIHGASSSFEGQIDQGLVLATNNIGQVCVGFNKGTGGYNNGRVAATLFTIDASNNTVSFGSYGLFSNSADGHSRSLSITYNAGGDTFVMTWGDDDDNDRLNANLREYSGTTWSNTTYDQKKLDDSNSALNTSVLPIQEDKASCIVFMALGTVKGQMHTFRTASGTDNISADSVNFLGFAESAISDGNTGTIILGGVVENQSGLVPGNGYLVNGVGGLQGGSFNGGPGLLAIASDKGVIRNGVA